MLHLVALWPPASLHGQSTDAHGQSTDHVENSLTGSAEASLCSEDRLDCPEMFCSVRLLSDTTAPSWQQGHIRPCNQDTMSLLHSVAPDAGSNNKSMFPDLQRDHGDQRHVGLQQPFGAPRGPQVLAGCKRPFPAPSADAAPAGVGCHSSSGTSDYRGTVQYALGSSVITQATSGDDDELLWLDDLLNLDQHRSVLEQLATEPEVAGPCVASPHAPAHQSEALGLQQPMNLDAVCRSASSDSEYQLGVMQCAASWQPCPMLTEPEFTLAVLPMAAVAADPAGNSSRQPVMFGASTASPAAGQRGRSPQQSLLGIAQGPLATAGSLCSSSNIVAFDYKGGAGAGAGLDTIQNSNTCNCKLARQICCAVADEYAATGRLTPSAKVKAAEALAYVRPCSLECLITHQLPTDSCGNSSNSSSSNPNFFISLPKARLGEKGGQRAPSGTAAGRNFNFNCNAPVKLRDDRLKALLGCQHSDKLFTVVSSDKRTNLTAIALTRLAVGSSAAADGTSNPVTSSSGGNSSDSLWCSRAVTCSKTHNKYQSQSFDLYMHTLFVSRGVRQ